MTRLASEQRRLFQPASQGDAGQVRAGVLAARGPAGWSALAAAWQGVQADLGLPAPAIAVDGAQGCQLWFSLAEPVAVDRMEAFMDGLRHRYLGDAAALASARAGVDGPLPPAQVAPERWSAFVAPDLAPLFADEPWLDHPPGDEAQADLLSRVQCVPAEAFAQAMALLAPASRDSRGEPPTPRHAPTAYARQDDPRRFLLEVMNDPAVDLRLRIEAARVLLQAGSN